MLFDKEFIKKLPKCDDKWTSPLVACVANELTEPHRQLKLYLEKSYEALPTEQKTPYYSRLRSLDDKEFIAQMFEFFVADFCRQHGRVDFNPKLENGKTPELLWEVHGHRCLLDVVTLFDVKDKYETNSAIDDLLNYLSSIEHYYYIVVSYKSVDIRNLKKSYIKKVLIKYLDSLDYDTLSPNEEIKINKFGFCGSFIPVKKQKKEKSKISFGKLGKPEDTEPVNAIEKRIKSKLNKYKWDGPIFVAICRSADFGVDWDDVASVLYGKVDTVYNAATQEVNLQIRKGGLVMPRKNGTPLNTSLTGILYCDLKWGEELPILQTKFLVNPFSKYSIELPVPSYPKADRGKINFIWTNNEDGELESH